MLIFIWILAYRYVYIDVYFQFTTNPDIGMYIGKIKTQKTTDEKRLRQHASRTCFIFIIFYKSYISFYMFHFINIIYNIL